MPSILATGLRFRWRRTDPFELVVPHFVVEERERVLLVGPSGSGKSTLLSLLSGMIVPAAGTIEVLGTDLGRLGAAARDRFRADNLGIIFQMFNLVPYLSCRDNVLLPLSFSKARQTRAASGGSAEAEAMRLLARLGLDPARFAGKIAAELSVGQQQRIAAARALIGRPGLIIADEPTSALDSDTQAEFLRLLSEESGTAGSSLLMVSHDLRLAPLFDRVISLREILLTDSPLEQDAAA
jgi:putative ABC transport system ATP-binding protein